MEKIIKKQVIGIILIMLIMLICLMTFNTVIFICETDVKYVEHSGLITMKWKVEKLLTTWLNFELDNSTNITIHTNYIWYYYEIGDTYTWNETEYTYPNWWLLW